MSSNQNVPPEVAAAIDAATTMTQPTSSQTIVLEDPEEKRLWNQKFKKYNDELQEHKDKLKVHHGWFKDLQKTNNGIRGALENIRKDIHKHSISLDQTTEGFQAIWDHLANLKAPAASREGEMQSASAAGTGVPALLSSEDLTKALKPFADKQYVQNQIEKQNNNISAMLSRLQTNVSSTTINAQKPQDGPSTDLENLEDSEKKLQQAVHCLREEGAALQKKLASIEAERDQLAKNFQNLSIQDNDYIWDTENTPILNLPPQEVYDSVGVHERLVDAEIRLHPEQIRGIREKFNKLDKAQSEGGQRHERLVKLHEALQNRLSAVETGVKQLEIECQRFSAASTEVEATVKEGLNAVAQNENLKKRVEMLELKSKEQESEVQRLHPMSSQQCGIEDERSRIYEEISQQLRQEIGARFTNFDQRLDEILAHYNNLGHGMDNGLARQHEETQRLRQDVGDSLRETHDSIRAHAAQAAQGYNHSQTFLGHLINEQATMHQQKENDNQQLEQHFGGLVQRVEALEESVSRPQTPNEAQDGIRTRNQPITGAAEDYPGQEVRSKERQGIVPAGTNRQTSYLGDSWNQCSHEGCLEINPARPEITAPWYCSEHGADGGAKPLYII